MASLKKVLANSWPRENNPLLVQFAIETEAINNTANAAHTKRLLHSWERFGILVYPRRGDTVIAKTIAKLAPIPRKHWQLAWAKVVKNNGRAFRYVSSDGVVFDWDGIDTPDALAASSNEFEVAVLEETRAAVLEIPDGESRCFGQVEGIRLWDIDISEKFSCSETLSSTPIGIGESIRDIWKQRFQRLAAYSREIVVVDQYAVRHNNIDGILRLLRFLDRDTKNCRVTIYSSPDSTGKAAQFIESQIRAETGKFSGNGIGSVSVHLFDESNFKKHAHDRHVRFDNSVVRIGRGIRVFENLRVQEATDVDLLVLKPGTREQKEKELGKLGTMVHTFRVPVP